MSFSWPSIVAILYYSATDQQKKKKKQSIQEEISDTTKELKPTISPFALLSRLEMLAKSKH